jgi:hypothetical protein
VLSARSVVSWAVPEDVLDGLDGLAALACDLVRCVVWAEAEGVGAYEGVSCDEAV